MDSGRLPITSPAALNLSCPSLNHLHRCPPNRPPGCHPQARARRAAAPCAVPHRRARHVAGPVSVKLGGSGSRVLQPGSCMLRPPGGLGGRRALAVCINPLLACSPATAAAAGTALFTTLPTLHPSSYKSSACPSAAYLSPHLNSLPLHPQVQVVQPVLLRGAAQQAAALERGHRRLLPQLCGARHPGLCKKLPAGVGGQHGGWVGGWGCAGWDWVCGCRSVGGLEREGLRI